MYVASTKYKTSQKFIHNFFNDPAKTPHQQTNRGKNTTSLAEVMKVTECALTDLQHISQR